MHKPRIMTVFGTRPEAIKMAPVVKALKTCPALDTTVVVSAQHRQMLDQVLLLFAILPDLDLNIMRHGQTLGDITAEVLCGLNGAYERIKPDLVLVHGDTTTTMAAALSAFYLKIPVGHVEAGLRSYDNYAPFPEEVNRKIVSAIAQLHFAPTATNRQNLIAERVKDESIHVVGNTVIDALLSTAQKGYVFKDDVLSRVDFTKKVLLVTCHRRENLGAPMRAIFSAIREIVERHAGVEVVFPVHSNPLVWQMSHEILGSVPGIHLLEPLEYEAFSNVMAKSHIVLTDSGGVQEEAPALGKPVLVLRNTTERPEAITAGTVKLVGVDTDEIIRECSLLLENPAQYDKMANAVNPYGDGKASQRILAALLKRFGLPFEEVPGFKGL